VRKIGVVEGDAPVSDNDVESITDGGDAAIQAWIDGQLGGSICATQSVLEGPPVVAGRRPRAVR